MADETATPGAAPAAMEAGAYEVIRKRLDAQAADLRDRMDRLNADRKAVFSSVETNLLATARLTTEHNCIPRDMTGIGPRRFVFGYNVTLGLKSHLAPGDVFGVYDYRADDHSFHVHREDLLGHDGFPADFDYLYKYYKNATFLRFHRTGAFLYAIFQVGRDETEVKAFKWQVDDEAGTLKYLGNRFDHEFVLPPAHEFDWKRARHDLYRHGPHPHVSIEDRVFVETVGGDLTIKVENNTESGKGIYSEPVENRDQILDDAEVHYALIGNLVLLKILPYQEKAYRHLVFHERTQEVLRVDGLAESCQLLPDDHGLVFPRGCLLQTGGAKLLETGLPPMRFERRIVSANGEDTLFVYTHVASGTYLMLHYNLVEQSLGTPIIHHGYALFPNGELIVLNGEGEPRKHHAVQVWQTPFVADQTAAEDHADSLFGKIGNAEIVRAMAECRGILTLLGKSDAFSGLYVELARQAGDVTDAYFWLDRPEAHGLRGALLEVKSTAEAALEEFEKVRRMRRDAATQVNALREAAEKAVRDADATAPEAIQGHVQQLATLRTLRGSIIAARDVRYADLDELTRLDTVVAEAADKAGRRCVAFLLRPDSLVPYRQRIAEQTAQLEKIVKATEAAELDNGLATAGGELELLIGVVSSLKIDDATETTRITEGISELFALLNQARSRVRTRRDELAKVEGAAEFAAQLNLLKQAVVNQIDLCDTPEKCDEALTRVMVRIEELEGKFGEFHEFADELIRRREETQAAFDTRRQALVEARNRRSQALTQAATRVLASINNRLQSLATPAEVHSFLAADAMAAKARDIVEQLRALGDSVAADDVTTRLKTLREQAVKQIRDKAELFVAGGDVIQLGAHYFTINRQPLELSLLPREGKLWFHLSGTRYFEAVDDPRLGGLEAYWDRESPAESPAVYRAEWLAWALVNDLIARGNGALEAFAAAELPAQTATVQEFMAGRFQEGYSRGVHDQDAALIAGPLAGMRLGLGLLRFSPAARALGLLFWDSWTEKTALAATLRATGRARTLFASTEAGRAVEERAGSILREKLATFAAEAALDDVLPTSGTVLDEAAAYLVAECLQSDHLPGCRSAGAVAWTAHFRRALTARRAQKDYDASLAAVEGQPVARFRVLCQWLAACPCPEADPATLPEAAALLLRQDKAAAEASSLPATRVRVNGLVGRHPRIENGSLELDFHEFQQRLARHASEDLPRYEQLHALRHELVLERRTALRLDEFKAAVLTSFVRNRLIDQVYLPLIGANLAKQLGTAGVNTRTDRMGLLLLISPPGYGKTTLMEYVANRLGITLVKINGPAIGHRVTSLDPAEAPNASARQEIERLNLALEMGDNVMIYLDDIQHCNPEFLQKFISLCDGQRKIEGVFKGRPRTYDLRGRKVAVVMAGNPYTEIGGKFQVPDMLANRADTYNLGEILGGHDDAFRDSYIENAVTSNATLARLGARSHRDVLTVLKIASGISSEGAEWEANHSADEIAEAVAVMKHLLRVRETILRVNQEYIRSAAMEDAFRTEPPFKLQGSYRNMAKIAEKIQPLMTEAEVDGLVRDHYRGEAQTLSQAAEANLLKWQEITGQLDDAGRARWEAIRKTFGRNLLLGGNENDPVARIGAHLGTFADGLGRIESAVRSAAGRESGGAALTEATMAQLTRIIEGLRAVPVNVEIRVLPVEPEAANNNLPVHVESTQTQGDDAAPAQ